MVILNLDDLTRKNLKIALILFCIYLIGFILLEQINQSPIIDTKTWLDSYIPFNEYFVLFYISWYVYMFLGFIYFIFIDKNNFQRTCFYLFTGMFISLIIYFICPNGQSLRVNVYNDNLFQLMIHLIYSIDTPTNVCPSLHVYNSIMMYVSLYKSEIFKSHKILNVILFVLVIFICLSTLFIKQHAVIDVIGGIILCIIIYMIGKYKFQY